MRLIFFAYFRLLPLMIIVACTGKQKQKEVLADGHMIQRKFYPNGNIKIEAMGLNDTIRDGWFRKYYENGKLKAEFNYKNDKLQGVQKEYYENGTIEYISYYSQDKAHGKTYSYYKNGRLKMEGNRFKGNSFGQYLCYYANGTLQAYNLKNYAGVTIYARFYDSNGKITKDEGRLLGQTYFKNFKLDSVKINQELLIELTVAEPPNTQTVVYVGEMGKNKEIINFDKYEVENSLINFKKTFYRTGKQEIYLRAEMHDLLSKVVKEEYGLLPISVK